MTPTAADGRKGPRWDDDVRPIADARRGSSLRRLGVERARQTLEQIPRAPGPEMDRVQVTAFDGPHGPAVVQQVLVYPGLERHTSRPSMAEFGDGPFRTAEDVIWMKSLYLGADPATDDQYGVPARARDLAGLPAAIVVTAQYDPLHDGVEVFGNRLREAGVETALLRYPGVGHGFLMQIDAFARARAAVTELGALVRARFTDSYLAASRQNRTEMEGKA